MSGTACWRSQNTRSHLLLDSLTLPLLNLGAFFLGYILALLGPDVTANLFVVNFLADLLGHGVTFLAIDSLTLATRNIPALLFRDFRALSVTDNTTLLRWNILADLILNSGALLLIDNFTCSLSSRCTLLLHDGRTLVLIPGGALLIKFS